jgi:hypothetical protein
LAITHNIGIDVQTARGCACAVVRADGSSVAAFWDANPSSLKTTVLEWVRRDGGDVTSIAVGIDSPRFLLDEPRAFYWEGSRSRWRRRRADDVGHGRHCEIVVSAHGLANPQWSPVRGKESPWMSLGLALFDQFSEALTFEVFPTASYSLFSRVDGTLTIDLSALAPGPKDMLDAYIAAATVREFTLERGTQVGGGDNLGTIILPRPLLEPIEGVLRWPAAP